ncbi:MAG: superoxide dismutase family protein [Blautia sp.]
MQKIINQNPEAFALIRGGKNYPDIEGTVLFYPLWGGSLVVADISGLPYTEESCANRFHGFHIHEGNSCSSNEKEEFGNTGNHWNPENCSHPDHTGDFPPLIQNKGYAFLIFFTDYFLPEEIVGHTVVIHAERDDFHTQPSGNAGMKIACGEVRSNLQEKG